MKKIFVILLAVVLLLSFAGCGGEESPASGVDGNSLSAEMLLGSYDVFYEGESGMGYYRVDVRLLNDRLTFVIDPDAGLNEENSFDSYDPKTGKAVWQQEQDGVTTTCEITFATENDTITITGDYVMTQGDMVIRYTLSGEMSEKL